MSCKVVLASNNNGIHLFTNTRTSFVTNQPDIDYTTRSRLISKQLQHNLNFGIGYLYNDYIFTISSTRLVQKLFNLGYYNKEIIYGNHIFSVRVHTQQDSITIGRRIFKELTSNRLWISNTFSHTRGYNVIMNTKKVINIYSCSPGIALQINKVISLSVQYAPQIFTNDNNSYITYNLTFWIM